MFDRVLLQFQGQLASDCSGTAPALQSTADYSWISAPSKIDPVSCPVTNMAFVAIKNGPPIRQLPDSRRPIFIATLRAVDSWPFFRVACSLRIYSDMLVARALKNSQLADGETHVSYGTGHLNQTLRDRAARDTIGCYLRLPQPPSESVNAFCLLPASGKACHAAGPAEAELRRGRPSSV
jgi:hypothetical protein